ncbi:MED6 mediator sub complex component-domain-containing protein [Chytriomyces sp. MP71]|nr:MED6 mediator sub complex component-domain-containing protein [Chytriomyces sp. MP71]
MQRDDDLLSVSFKDTAFLEQARVFGLHPANALDYFKQSPQFYDKSSINGILDMQARHNSLQATELDHRQLTGVWYELDMSSYSMSPSLFVVRKYLQHSPEKRDLVAVYYIAEGTIYQAPDMHTLLSNRLLTSLHQVKTAFAAVSVDARFQPARPYHWGYEEDMQNDEEDWRIDSSGSNAMAVDVQTQDDDDDDDNDDDDDGIVIEAGGCEDDRDNCHSIKFNPLAATSLQGVDAGREFTGSLDGLIARMQNAGASWGSGAGIRSEADAAAKELSASTAIVTATRGLSLEEMKAAAKARTAEFAAAAAIANAAFKRPEPMDGKTPGMSGGSGTSGRTSKKPRRSASTLQTPSAAYTPSELGRTPEYSGPGVSVIPVQSPMDAGLVSSRRPTSASNPGNAKKR